MASEQLEEPYALLSIPKPFGGERAKSFASPVLRHSAQSTKQRAEVAVAIDGEGVYIYDIANPRLITSYAVSPQTQFMCKPCSTIRKKSDRTAQRLTYAAVYRKDSRQASIICFIEDVGKKAIGGAGNSATSKEEYIFPDRSTIIRALIATPRDSSHESIGNALDIFVVHEHKVLQSFSGDLKTIRWTFDWHGTQHADTEVRFCHAELLAVKQLRKGLLKVSNEAAAVVDTWGLDENTANALVVVRMESNKGSGRRRLLLSLVRLPSLSRSQATSASLGERVTTYDVRELPLPRNYGLKSSFPHHGFHIAPIGNHVFLQVHESLTHWDLNELRPAATPVVEKGLLSYLPLGYTELLVAQSRSCSIVDLEWQTTQAEVFAKTAVQPSQASGSKRGRNSSLTSFEDFELVDLFYGTGLAIALKPGSLIAIPMASAKSHKRQRTGPKTLADAVGKTVAQGKGSLFANSKSTNNKQLSGPFADTVRALVKENKVAELEEFLAKDLDLSYERVTLQDHPEGGYPVFADLEVFTEDQAGRDVVYWTFPKEKSSLIRRTDWSKASLVSDLIFCAADSKSDSIKARFYSPSIYQWLAVTGLLTPNKPGISNEVSAGNVLLALASADATLSTMGEFLSWDFHLDLESVLRALDLTIESLDGSIEQSRAEPKNGKSDDGSPAESESESVANAFRAAEKDLALATSSLNEGTTIRGGLLHSIFDRINAFDDKVILRGFRKLLTPRKMVFLINLLRIELADGGWTTRYLDRPYDEKEDDEGSQELALPIIIKLLNAAIDAIGHTGWNVTLPADKQLNSDQLISVLRAEITAAMEGLEECQALDAYLEAFEKCCADAKAHEKKGKKRHGDAAHTSGLVRNDIEEAMLPMGGRTPRLEMTRTSKGGKVTAKSKSALGQELSMRVPKFSLEKIRF